MLNSTENFHTIPASSCSAHWTDSVIVQSLWSTAIGHIQYCWRVCQVVLVSDNWKIIFANVIMEIHHTAIKYDHCPKWVSDHINWPQRELVLRTGPLGRFWPRVNRKVILRGIITLNLRMRSLSISSNADWLLKTYCYFPMIPNIFKTDLKVVPLDSCLSFIPESVRCFSTCVDSRFLSPWSL